MKTRSVLVSGAFGDTVLVRRPLPLAPLDSALVLLEESRDLLELSIFRGRLGPSDSAIPLDGLSRIKLTVNTLVAKTFKKQAIERRKKPFIQKNKQGKSCT